MIFRFLDVDLENQHSNDKTKPFLRLLLPLPVSIAIFLRLFLAETS